MSLGKKLLSSQKEESKAKENETTNSKKTEDVSKKLNKEEKQKKISKSPQEDVEKNTSDNNENNSNEVNKSKENGAKKRKRRKDMTPEEKKRRLKIDLTITFSVFGAIALIFIIFAIVCAVGQKANFEKAASMPKIGTQYNLVSHFDPLTSADKTLGYDDELGCYTFVTNEEFVVLQLTDIHIGAGTFSTKKDAMAIEAVYDVVKKVQPDLVVVTGDIAYPVPFQAGTFNNKKEAEMFATLMDSLEVYWTLTFGNHDTEIYSLYDRDEIADVYSDPKWKYCLFEEGPSNIDGSGNSFINVQNTSGKIVQTLYMIDSHSYTDGDSLGIAWKYDKIKDSQINWYASKVNAINNENVSRGKAAAGDIVKSLMFFHIPVKEYQTAWQEFTNNGHKNTANVTYYYGIAGEKGEKCYTDTKGGVMFDKVLELNSTKGLFCGHDHYNNFSIDYKGVRLTYGMSIDHLAYSGIWKETDQRGGTKITIALDGSFDVTPVPHVQTDISYLYAYK